MKPKITAVVPANREEWLKLRSKNLNSTDIAALFGVNPYSTEFELWHRMKSGDTVQITETERMKWGTRLQDAIAFGIADDKKWKVRRMDEYLYCESRRLGSSFDYAIGVDEILEIKNVGADAYKSGWLETGDSIEAPPHIELQVQHQLLVSGAKKAYIGALVGGNKLILLERNPDIKIHEAIEAKAAAFWKSIDEGQAPKPDFEKDAAFIRYLYSYAEVGKVITASTETEELAKQYEVMSKDIKVLTAKRDAIKSQLLLSIGDAEKVKGEGFSISAGIIGEAELSYTRKAYRDLRVFFKKVKSE